MKQQFENVLSFLGEIGSEIEKQRQLNAPKKLIDEEFKPFMYHGDGYETHGHIILRFPNGYGASVVNGRGTYKLELAKIFFVDEAGEYDVCEEPHGYLDKEKMNNLIREIQALK
jgi:hypothetical protein